MTTVARALFMHWLGTCLACILLLPDAVTAEDRPVDEYAVKAAFLYNFARFTSWPDDDAISFRLCILGDDPFGAAASALREKPVHDLPLVLSYISDVNQTDNCRLLFISDSKSQQLEEILLRLGRRSILTISDINGFIDHGGVIGFRSEQNRIRFEINITAASEAGLTISSKLLSLASTVKTGR